MFYDTDLGVWERTCRLSDNLKRLLVLAGFDESIYTNTFKEIA
ncbi:MAG: hypothetical protein N4A48_12720 [Tepidibacter sp.]|jgi:hypothetical protein|nr:hypothetical protein [Tepidibacter sp.]MCT4509592.1 hypothetical protein [Tepidibacter sp.]